MNTRFGDGQGTRTSAGAFFAQHLWIKPDPPLPREATKGQCLLFDPHFLWLLDWAGLLFRLMNIHIITKILLTATSLFAFLLNFTVPSSFIRQIISFPHIILWDGIRLPGPLSQFISLSFSSHPNKLISFWLLRFLHCLLHDVQHFHTSEPAGLCDGYQSTLLMIPATWATTAGDAAPLQDNF